MANLYVISRESGELFGGWENMFLLEKDDESCIKTLENFLKDDYDVPIISMKVEREEDSAAYFAEIIVEYETGEDSIIVGAIAHDEYHIFNMGEPKQGIIYPHFGEE